MNVLKYKPFLIKPNNFELGEMFGVELKSTDEIIEYARKLKEMGAVNVLVSMASDGAVLLDENDKTGERLTVEDISYFLSNCDISLEELKIMGKDERREQMYKFFEQ